MNALLFSLMQACLVILLAPLTVGIVRASKARFQNRRGASVFQPYWALLSLCKKEMTVTKHASWVFFAVPFAVLASACALALLVPTFSVVGMDGLDSIFVIAAVLALGSFFLVLGGMDVASTFGGMGSSREMTLAALVEPVVILVLSTLGFAAHAWGLGAIAGVFAADPWYVTHPFLVFTLLSLGFVVLAENARYPVDNPATHLELTMVHEAMILEYSGPYLAMLEAASAIKLTVLLAFFLQLAFPWMGLAFMGGMFVWPLLSLVAKLVVGGFLVACVESLCVKMRFYRMQEYMATAYFLGLSGFILTLVF